MVVYLILKRPIVICREYGPWRDFEQSLLFCKERINNACKNKFYLFILGENSNTMGDKILIKMIFYQICLKKLLDNSKDGFIFLTFGSMLQLETFPIDILNKFLTTF